MGYNIKQANPFKVASSTLINPPLPVLEPKRVKKSDGTYEIIMVSSDKKYITAVTSANILKLGYCCEPKGIIYPIFFKIDGNYEQIAIGSDGIYEMQSETYLDANNVEYTSDVIINEVLVPADIDFTLEYVISTT